MNYRELMAGSGRPIALLGVLIVLLALTGGWSFFRLSSSHAAAVRAADDLASCEKLAMRIRTYRQRPSLAATREIEHQELSKAIEEAARAASIPSSGLIRVWPEQSRRVGSSPYKEKPTQVLLRSVSIKQVVLLLHKLSGSDRGLRVRSLRLLAPREDRGTDGWTAEATVVSLIYAPVSANNAGAAGARGDLE